MVKSDEIIGKIPDNAQVMEGLDILDVACGTGVMIPYYPCAADRIPLKKTMEITIICFKRYFLSKPMHTPERKKTIIKT